MLASCVLLCGFLTVLFTQIRVYGISELLFEVEKVSAHNVVNTRVRTCRISRGFFSLFSFWIGLNFFQAAFICRCNVYSQHNTGTNVRRSQCLWGSDDADSSCNVSYTLVICRRKRRCARRAWKCALLFTVKIFCHVAFRSAIVKSPATTGTSSPRFQNKCFCWLKHNSVGE